ncbi:membrane or secreted protein [Hwangdonia seohaensis]|uniref:Membrane or secreted protein n=1 Tax=Hwangdonia seohaensis TaxID=1240727 RepID=A0ABW3RAI6_9FLAO|nr:membrane or secreted protein [Hwangdonia seohaensis]
MKKIVFIWMVSILSFGLNAQSIIGAWEGNYKTETGENLKSVVIFTDGYQATAVYNADTGTFISTTGGTWELDGDTMTEKVEFDTNNPERVGTEKSFKIVVTNFELEIVGSDNKLKKIDNGTPGKLQGAWLMSGRVRNGETQSRDVNRPRKTMKTLSGTRFQWIAYNTETKQFMGTGGGTYTTIDGKYTENIEFFSRDDTRVGASLKFDFSLVDGHWVHQGFSSKGDPLHEIWSLRN